MRCPRPIPRSASATFLQPGASAGVVTTASTAPAERSRSLRRAASAAGGAGPIVWSSTSDRPAADGRSPDRARSRARGGRTGPGGAQAGEEVNGVDGMRWGRREGDRGRRVDGDGDRRVRGQAEEVRGGAAERLRERTACVRRCVNDDGGRRRRVEQRCRGGRNRRAVDGDLRGVRGQRAGRGGLDLRDHRDRAGAARRPQDGHHPQPVGVRGRGDAPRQPDHQRRQEGGEGGARQDCATGHGETACGTAETTTLSR